MASKQAVTTKTVNTTAAAPAPAAAAKTVRATKATASTPSPKASSTKAKTPRVSSAKHSKTVTLEATAPETVTATLVEAPVAASTPESRSGINPQEAIAKIAYGYWVARGYQGGNAHEDWLRAEREYLRSK
jgi:hypothetical protein